MKKYRGKGRRNFDPSADGRYTTTLCNIMATERARTAKAGGLATNSAPARQEKIARTYRQGFIVTVVRSQFGKFP